MSRQAAIDRASEEFDNGSFRAILQKRISRPTESQNPARSAELLAYLSEDLQPALQAMGFQNVFSLVGGFDAWAAAQRTVVKPRDISFE